MTSACHFTGAVSELRAAAYFAAQGYQIWTPQIQQSKVDFLLTRGREIRRVQVKTATWSTHKKTTNQYLRCNIHGDTGTTDYLQDEFDILVIVDPDGSRLWDIPWNGVHGKIRTLTLDSEGPTAGRRTPKVDPQPWERPLPYT